MTNKEMKTAFTMRIIAAVVTGMVGLFGFWSGSFASNENLRDLEHRVNVIEDKSMDYAKKTDLQLVLSGLCIINKKTCQLGKDIGK